VSLVRNYHTTSKGL